MFTDVTDLCDSEAEDGDLDLESTAFSDNTDFAERTLARRETFHKHSVQLYVKATCGDDYEANVTSSNKEGVPRQRTSRGVGTGWIGRALCHNARRGSVVTSSPSLRERSRLQ